MVLLPVSGEARSALETAAQDDSLAQFLDTLQQSGQTDSVAACVLALLSSGLPLDPPTGNYGPSTAQFRSQQGRRWLQGVMRNPDSEPEVAVALASRCLTWLQYGRWRECAQGFPDRGIIVASFLKNNLVEDGGGGLETAEIVDHVDYWRSVAGDDLLESILKTRAETGELAKVLADREFTADHEHLYMLAFSDERTDQPYRKFLREALEGRTKAEWQEALANDGGLIRLAIRLRPYGLVLGLAFQDALASEAEESLTKTSGEPALPSRVGLLELLDFSARRVFSRRLLKFFDADGHRNGLIEAYGPILRDALLDAGPENSYETIRKIIEDHDERETTWLAEVLSSWKPGSKAVPVRGTGSKELKPHSRARCPNKRGPH